MKLLTRLHLVPNLKIRGFISFAILVVVLSEVQDSRTAYYNDNKNNIY